MTPKEITTLAGHRLLPPWVMKLALEVAAAEREACAKESLEVLENLRKETIAQCQQGMVEAYKLGQSEEREACAVAAEQVVPRHTECGNKIAAAIRARGDK